MTTLIQSINNRMSAREDFQDEWKDYAEGKQIRLLDGLYKYVEPIKAIFLKKGDKIGAGWVGNGTYGFDFVEILGVYALDAVMEHKNLPHHIHHNVREALESVDARSLTNIDTREHSIRLLCKSLEGDDDSVGDWYYVFNGRFCRGSGANPLSFFEIAKL